MLPLLWHIAIEKREYLFYLSKDAVRSNQTL